MSQVAVANPAPAQADTTQFDMSSAIPETEDGKSVSAMPSFDLSSAVPEDQISQEKPKSWEENVLNFLAKPFVKSPKDRQAEASNIYAISKSTGMSMEDVSKHYDQFSRNPKVTGMMPEPTKGQYLGGMMTEGMLAPVAAEGGIAAGTLLTTKGLVGLGVFTGIFKLADMAEDKFLPRDTNQRTKDLLDVGKLFAGGIGGHVAGEAVEKGVGSLVDNLMGNIIPHAPDAMPTMDLATEHIKAITDSKLSDEAKADLLNRLGVTQQHIDASVSSGKPIRVPMSNVLNMAQSPHWDDIAEKITENGLPKPKIQTPEELAIEGKMSHPDALQYLGVDDNGKPIGDGKITVTSSSGELGQGSKQTGLEGIRKETLDVVKNVSDKNNIPITIVGGTEEGVHNDTLDNTHIGGDKLDLRTRNNPELNKLVESWESVGKRKLDGAKGFKDPDSNAIFWKEGNHWDVEVPKNGSESPDIVKEKGTVTTRGDVTNDNSEKVANQEPVVSEGKTKKSQLYENLISDENEKNKNNPDYNELNMRQAFDKGIELQKSNPDLVERVAKGFEPTPDGHSTTALKSAYYMSLRDAGKTEEANAYLNQASRTFTRGGQEIAAVKYFGERGKEKFSEENTIMKASQDRLKAVGRKLTGKGTPAEKLFKEFDKQKENIKKTVRQTLSDDDIQKVINSIICP